MEVGQLGICSSCDLVVFLCHVRYVRSTNVLGLVDKARYFCFQTTVTQLGSFI